MADELYSLCVSTGFCLVSIPTEVFVALAPDLVELDQMCSVRRWAQRLLKDQGRALVVLLGSHCWTSLPSVVSVGSDSIDSRRVEVAPAGSSTRDLDWI